MKKKLIPVFLLLALLLFACKKDEVSIRFNYLTSNTWQSDSLLANGEDAGGPGQMLEKFNGEAIFNEDGTGIFGSYSGEWHFAYDETKIVIDSDSLAFPLTTNVEELTASSLKITTAFPNLVNPEAPTAIRMTFNAK